MTKSNRSELIAYLTPEERLELDEIEKAREAENFASFVADATPRFAVTPPHLQPLYELIDRSRHEQIFATISEPPRHGKSVTFAHAFAYRVKYDPACQNLYVTYESGRSRAVGLAARNLVLRMKIPLARGASAANDWKTTFGGGLLSSSLGGRVNGEGVNGGLIVVDDLIKGWRAARSKKQRDGCWEFFLSDVWSRVEGGASVIVMNTRWNDDDVIGRLHKDPLGLGVIPGTKPWIHINMPAVHDGSFNAIDEREHPSKAHPLWLDVDSNSPGDREAALRWYALKRASGEPRWWSLYQGTPRKDGGKVFGLPSRYTFKRGKSHGGAVQPFDWTGKRGCISIDPAGTEKKRADHTGVAVVAMDDIRVGTDTLPRGWLVDGTKRQISVPEAARQALQWKEKYGLPLVIEGGNMGANAVHQVLKELEPDLDIEMPPMFGDKYTRAQPLAGAWNDGRFLIPTYIDIDGHRLDDVDWIDNVLEQADEFTGEDGAEDDLIDAVAHGFNFLLGSDRAMRAAM